jgi:hypothetical protein
MPKLPPTNHFTLHVDVTVAGYGPVKEALASFGDAIIDVRDELVTTILTYRQKQTHDVSAEQFLREWIKDHPTFGASEAVKHCREAGRTNGAAYTALRVLAEKGELKKLGPGNYQRADVKALAAPKKKAKATPKKIERERHEIDHREFILRYARQHGGRVSRSKLMAYFEAHDRKAASAGGALNVLVARKMLKQLGDGEYILLAKGGAKPPAPKKPAPKKGNGAAVVEASTSVVEEAAHG